MRKISVLIVDDHSVVRNGIAAILKFERNVRVSGFAANGAEAVEKATALKPDVVIMDLMMPVMSGVEATKRLLAEVSPAPRVLILTSYGSANDLRLAIEAGATGAVLKDTSDENLVCALRTVAAGGRAIAPEIRQMFQNEEALPALTTRQLEILTSVTRGLTTKAIADQMGISSSAVKQHLGAICEKLGADSRSEAVAIALHRQLLKL